MNLVVLKRVRDKVEAGRIARLRRVLIMLSSRDLDAVEALLQRLGYPVAVADAASAS